MMRNLFCLLMLGFASWLSVDKVANANEVADSSATQVVVGGQVISLDLIDAHREYQAAKLRMHEYRFTSFPQQRRILDQQAKLAKAEQAMLKRRLHDYQPFLQVGDYSPVRTATESYQLALIATEQQLREIKEGQRALLRLNRQQVQIYQLDLLRAVARMALAKQARARSLGK